MFNLSTMLVVSVLFSLLCAAKCESSLIPKVKEISNLEKCVVDVIEEHFREQKVVSYIEFYSDINILPALYKSGTVAIVSRINFQRVPFKNLSYLLNIKDIFNFLLHFDCLRKDPDWNPAARFIILFEKLDSVDEIFEKLRNLHIINVILINATNQADVYTYNPFENSACGRYFERIVSFGPCASANTSEFFPNKMKNGLRNCTINIAVSHLPPFTMNPGSCTFSDKYFCKGIEQFAIDMISERENFKVNYSYVDFAQEFSDIDRNMTAVGSFSMIQKNETDGLLGFTFLSDVRANAFSYVFQYAVYNDRLVYLVKKADYVPVWKNIYLEFDGIVWLLIFIMFAISTAVIIILSRAKDNGAILLKMWDSLFLHGFGVRRKFGLRIFIIIWIWFAFMINAFYQSTLMSLTTHPSKDYQISTEEDLHRAHLRPCITSAITDFLQSFADMKFYGDNHECTDLVMALEKVGKSYDVYTIMSYKLYKYNMPLFTSDDVELYDLREEVMGTIYALFLYKGFPWRGQMEYRALQLKENGLIQRHSRNVYHYHQKKYLSEKSVGKRKSRAIVPWEMLLVGCAIATFVFMVEVFIARK